MRPDLTLISPYPRLGARHDGESGVASYTANLAHALSAEGARVCVVAPEVAGEPRRGQDGPVEVRRSFPARTNRAVAVALAAAAETGAPLTHLQHELFLYSGATGMPATLAALARRRTRGQPTVITMHQVVDPAAVDRSYTAMHRVRVPAPAARAAITAVQRLLPRLADRLIVHEPAFRQVVPDAVVVPHGIEVPRTSEESRADVRTRLGIPPDRLIALCFGFLAPYKGLEIALAAAELVAGSGPAADRVCVVVAGGPHPRLAAQADDYPAALQRRWGAVARFTGYVPDAQVADWFTAADVALLCYPEPHASSGPLALALAYRTPVLLSRRLAQTVGADDELAVGPDPQSWADRLTSLATRTGELAGLRDRVVAMSADRAWPTVARRHLELYREVTGAERPAAPDLAVA